MSKRLEQWEEFSQEVGNHIEHYAIPQYGDAPNDLMSSYSKGDLDLQLAKYVKRQRNGGGCRGIREDLRDYLKIAHIACIAYAQLKNEVENDGK